MKPKPEERRASVSLTFFSNQKLTRYAFILSELVGL